MADHASGGPVEVGAQMDYAEHEKTYGMFLADNGSPWYLSGAPNDAWNNDELRQLLQVKGSDFEAVDSSSLMIDENSAKAKPQ